MLIPALSIRQPWAHLIVRPDITDPRDRAHAIANGILKDLENRDWPTRKRGGFLVHASKAMTEADYWGADDVAAGAFFGKGDLPSGARAGGPVPTDSPRGGVVGYAEVIDCLDSSQSPWFMGEYAFKLANPIPLPFLPVRGMLGFFQVDVPDDYLPGHLLSRIMR